MNQAGFETLRLPADGALFARLARLLIDRHGDALAECDVLLPVMAHAPALRGALLAYAGRALFMPRMLTPSLLAARWQGDAPVDPHPRRLLRLVAQLRQQAWLGDADPWSAAQELLELADALAALPAPPDENALQQGFERAHGLTDSAALSLEARLVHAVWHSDCTGTPGHARAVTQALMRAAGAARRPLIHLSALVEPVPAWLEMHAARVPVLHVQATRALADTPVARVLHAAWPPGPPLGASPGLTPAPSRDDALELA
ncbi:MAG: PD-(D/E)XK nuclease family protein, partial [Methyloversatilis sp.]|nr:PD-(D/E)XK nuclease family protein [Methyloversatilis sp.]